MKRKDSLFLKNVRVKNDICNEQHKDLSLLGSRPESMYGLVKVNKIDTDSVPSVPPSFSAVNIPIYKFAKFLVPLLGLLKTNEYTIKDSSTFAEELQSFVSKLVMTSFKMESSTFLYKKELTSVLKIYLKTGLFP